MSGTAGQDAVERVIRTATSLVIERLAPREAVTLLATQVPHALSVAPALVSADGTRAGAYADVLRALSSDLRAHEGTSADPTDLAAVLADLDRVATALTEPRG